QLVSMADKDIVVVHADHAYERTFLGNRYRYGLKGRFHLADKSKLGGDLYEGYLSRPCIATCTALYRRSVLDQYLEIASKLGNGAFYDVVVATYALSQGRAAFLDRVCAVYRLSPNSATRSGARGALLLALEQRRSLDLLAQRLPGLRNSQRDYWISSAYKIVKAAYVTHDNKTLLDYLPEAYRYRAGSLVTLGL